MDGDGLKEYVPLESLQKQKDSAIEKSVQKAAAEDELLTIVDLVKKNSKSHDPPFMPG